MEGYITLKEASEKWKISERRIRTLCLQDRSEGTEKMGTMWTIPSDIVKPADQRIKSGKYIKKKEQ